MELYPPTARAWIYTKAIGLNRLARRTVRASLTRLHEPAWSVGNAKRKRDSGQPSMRLPNVRASLKTAASYGFRLTGVDRLVGTLSGTSRIPPIISYHRVVENVEKSSQSSISPMLISTRMFEQHLDWIGRHYEFVSLDDVGNGLKTGRRSDGPLQLSRSMMGIAMSTITLSHCL